MRRGLCVKCGTPTVYRKLNGISQGGGTAGAYVYTSWLTSASMVENLICTRCGYFETYVVDERKMAEVVNTWEKVGQSA
jgi:predicted nucleic-acid-binding Zn-ribbon protein